jgi:glutamine phosphoribosylpyrophosphate amidotransferase
MCAVAGLYSIEYSPEAINLFREILKQSQIRGKHASGVSYLLDGLVVTEKTSSPIIDFIEDFDMSDLKVMIAPLNLSIVHNGVITQENPLKWKERFGYNCETMNDSELIYRAIREGEEPLVEFTNSSMSVIVLKKDEFSFYRNGNRPLWYYKYKRHLFVASTKDIINRAFLKVTGKAAKPINCKAGIKYSYDGVEVAEKLIMVTNDIQNIKLDCVEKYSKVNG